MKRETIFVAAAFVLTTAACDKPSSTTQTSAANTTTAAATNPPTAPEAKKETKNDDTKPKTLTPAVTFKGVGLATPESVLYDDQADMYLVSNVEGKPLDADGKGFISKLTPDGKVETLKWIEGGKNKVTLNAPKGLAVTADTLWVADLDTVRMFDRKTGAPKGEVKVPGATFLNDVTVASDGRVLVSDTGMKADAKGGFEPAKTDAIYAIDKNKKLTTIAKTTDLGNPNGLYAVGDKVWVVTFGSGEMYSLTLDGKGTKADAKKLPKGTLDGIVGAGSDGVLVSSWEGSNIYRGKPGEDFKEVITDVKSPADIGYDTKRGRVLVPLFQVDEVRAYDMK